MSLSARQSLPRFLQIGRAETLRLPVYRLDGSAAPATAVTYALSDAEGTAVVAATAGTVPGGVSEYALAAQSATAPQQPWREAWVVTVDGVAVTFENEVYLCRVAPALHVTAEDLYALHPQWRRQLPRARGSTLSEVIEVAWQELICRLLGDGILPHRALNWWALAVPLKYRAAELVCRDFMTDAPTDSRWAQLREVYAQRWQDEYEQHLSLQRDDDEDGVADNPGQTAAAVAGPARSRWRWGHA